MLKKAFKLLILLSLSTSVFAQDDVATDTAANTSPCGDEGFSDFDFWLGEWEVHDGNGNFAGTNSIKKTHNGCLMTEDWVSVSGFEGSSVNFLDRITGEWVQVWNDTSGGQIQVRGGLTEDGMALSGTIHYVSNGNTYLFRGLWTPLPDGRVRQFFEQSVDEGATWSTWFEGFYSRKSGD